MVESMANEVAHMVDSDHSLKVETNQNTERVENFLGEMKRENLIRYSHMQLETIMNSKLSTSVGSGTFGDVYKGKLHNNVQVAVKVLKELAIDIEDQFISEVSTLGKTYHKNLVKLYGFCFEPKMKALVYEFMENGCLKKVLSDNQNLNWETLYNIAIGTAKGLSYLHEDCDQIIIHHDIKTSNILLNSKFSPKIGDFGLAKLCNQDISHVTMDGYRGTPGYIAPELLTGRVTYKCDVYSYGMMLFKILGRKHRLGESHWSFPSQVWERFDKGQLEDIFEVCSIEEKDREKAKRITLIALWCVQYMPDDRPSMSNVVRHLEGHEEVKRPPNPFRHLDSSSLESKRNSFDPEDAGVIKITKPHEEGEKGKNGNMITQMATIFLGPWGGSGGGDWSFNEEGKLVIKQIVVLYGEGIDSITFSYDGDGGSKYSHKIGGNGIPFTATIDLKWPEEYLTSISGYDGPLHEKRYYAPHDSWIAGPHIVRSLTFFTNKNKYGPYGPEQGNHWSSPPIKGGKIVGFHGRAGLYLDAIGVCIQPSNV